LRIFSQLRQFKNPKFQKSAILHVYFPTTPPKIQEFSFAPFHPFIILPIQKAEQKLSFPIRAVFSPIRLFALLKLRQFKKLVNLLPLLPFPNFPFPKLCQYKNPKPHNEQ